MVVAEEVSAQGQRSTQERLGRPVQSQLRIDVPDRLHQAGLDQRLTSKLDARRCAPRSRISRAVMVFPRASPGSDTWNSPTRNSDTFCAVSASQLARSLSFAIRSAWTAIATAN